MCSNEHQERMEQQVKMQSKLYSQTEQAWLHLLNSYLYLWNFLNMMMYHFCFNFIYSFGTQVILILVLIDIQYSQKAIFSFEEGSIDQNNSSSGSHHLIKKSSPAKYLICPLEIPPLITTIWKTMGIEYANLAKILWQLSCRNFLKVLWLSQSMFV